MSKLVHLEIVSEVDYISLILLPSRRKDPFRHIMSDADKQSHDRGIIQQEKQKRLFKIKEHKLLPQQDIISQIALDECVQPIYRNQNSHPAENPFARV